MGLCEKASVTFGGIGRSELSQAPTSQLVTISVVPRETVGSLPAGFAKKPTFSKSDGFLIELRRRVDEYFLRTGLAQRDCPQMYRKTAILFATCASSYVLLVFFAATWWQAFPLAILLGLTIAGIGFNVAHDGGHQAYSSRLWVNKLMSMSLDVVGGSSYLWHWKHAVLHHTYVNITGHDADIDLGILGRLSPHQKRYWFHRWQHLYLWPLYGFLAMAWHFYSDFHEVITGQIGGNRIPRPKGGDLLLFVGGKVVFFTLAFAIPLLFHPVWAVLLTYGVISFVLGLVLSIVFQLAHAVEEAEFPLPRPETGNMENTWATHQVETTVDFARQSRALAWLVGGLNFQIEHHLFPRICHIHYPAISLVVEDTCREYGVRYTQHATFGRGLASHYRWLRTMGMVTEST